MNQLDRLEALAQGLIEGTFNRLFQTQLRPAEASVINGRDRTETKEVLALDARHIARRWVLQLDARQLRLGEPVINIGRALDNDVILSDPTVSRYHAQLRWREGCYHLCPPAVEDGLTGQQLNGTQRMGRSTPWTTVNQRSVIRHPLASSDVIVLGRTVLNVTVESARV